MESSLNPAVLFYPVYLYNQGLSLADIGWVVGIYGFVWGGSQFFTGPLSDRIGRKKPIVWGMWLCGAGVGMALLYPNLSAAVSDITHPNWRGSAIGIYRFWRDLGYGIGTILLGAMGSLTDSIEMGFWFTVMAMLVSGLIVALWGRETHPRNKPEV